MNIRGSEVGRGCETIQARRGAMGKPVMAFLLRLGQGRGKYTANGCVERCAEEG